MKKIKLSLTLSAIFLFCLICTTSAFAETEIKKLTQTVSPTVGEADSITVTTADKFQQGIQCIYFEITGLNNDNYNYSISDSENIDSYDIGSVDKKSSDCSIISKYIRHYDAGEYTFTVSVYNDLSTVKYENISFTIEICENIVPTEENITFETTFCSSGAEAISIQFKSLNDYTGKTAKLIGKDKLIYGATENSLSSFNSYNNIEDVRYKDIFKNCTINCDGYTTYISISNSRELTEGKYDVAVYDGSEQILYLENAVEITKTPLIAVSTPWETFPSPHDGDTEFYLCANITNSLPEDFSVELYDNSDALIAKDTSWLCTDIYANYDTYAIKMNTIDNYKLKNGNYYFKVKSEKDFKLLTNNSKIWVSINGNILNTYAPDERYANFVIKTKGYNSDEQCKIVLKKSNNTLGTVYQFPTEDGIFDVEFKDENGNIIELENYTNYEICIYEYSAYDNDWETYGNNTYYYTSYNKESSSSTTSKEITGNTYFSGKKLTVYAFIAEDKASNYSDNLFSVKALSVDGTEYTIDSLNFTRTAFNNKKQIYLYMQKDITTTLPLGHYKLSLLYDGKIISQSNYYDTLSKAPYFSYYINYLNSISAYSAISVDGIEGDITSAKLLLFDSDKLNMTPDYTLSLTTSDNKKLDLPTGVHDVSKKYYYQIKINDKLQEANFYDDGDYFIPSGFTVPDTEYTISVKKCENGSITLSKETATFGNFVYVSLKPDDGYEYVPNSVKVNGKSISGRSFFVKENSEVTAEFRKIKKQLYTVNINDYIYDGTISTEKSRYEENETVKVSVTPDNGYKLTRLYYIKANTWDETEISLDTCEFKMPKFEIKIYAEFTQKASYYINTANACYGYPDIILNDGESSCYEGDTVKISIKNAFTNEAIDTSEIENAYYITYSGETVTISGDSFIMPSENVTVYCNLKKYAINTSVTGYGRIYYYSHCCYFEGSTVSEVQNATFLGDSFNVYFQGYGSFNFVKGSFKVNGITSENNSFIMPKESVTFSATFTSETYRKITIEDSSNGTITLGGTHPYDDGQDYGENVYLNIYPDNGYKLKSLTYNGIDIPYNKSNNCYMFTMPDEDVVIKAEFVDSSYVEMYTVTFKNYDGSVLYEESVAGGQSAKYEGEAPSKPMANKKMYIFTGWDKELTNITKDTEITAQFKESDYMEIYTESDLSQIENNLDGCYLLMNDITLTAPWTPIGGTQLGNTNAFTGVFDGNKHVISNVVISEVNDYDYQNEVSGFFGTISGATIKNLGLQITYGGDNDYHNSETRIGGLAGVASDSNISCCYVTGNIKASAKYSNVIGGLIGDSDNNISNSYASVNITAKGSYPKVGGLIASASNGKITNCYSNGEIVLSEETETMVGGLLAQNYSEKTVIENSYYLKDNYTYTQNDFGKALFESEMKSCYTYWNRSEENQSTKSLYCWDFDNIWTIDSKQNGGYPTLKFKDTTTDISVDGYLHHTNVNLITFKMNLSKWVTGDIIMLGYKNGKFISIDDVYNYSEDSQYFDGGNFKFYYGKEVPDTIKIMVWDKLNNLKPLTESVEADVSTIELYDESKDKSE